MQLLIAAASDDTIILFSTIGGILFAAAVFGFWVWMLHDCITNELPGSREKITWTVLIIVMGLLGAFAYNVGRRKKRIRELGR